MPTRCWVQRLRQGVGGSSATSERQEGSLVSTLSVRHAPASAAVARRSVAADLRRGRPDRRAGVRRRADRQRTGRQRGPARAAAAVRAARRRAGGGRRRLPISVTDGGDVAEPSRCADSGRPTTPAAAAWRSSARCAETGASSDRRIAASHRRSGRRAVRRRPTRLGLAGQPLTTPTPRGSGRQAAHHPQRHRQRRQVDVVARQRLGEGGPRPLDPLRVLLLPAAPSARWPAAPGRCSCSTAEVIAASAA